MMPAARDGPASGAIDVLALEDNAGDLDLIREALADSRAARFAVTSASHLGEALDRLARQTFDVILSDLHVPDSQGIETFRRLRAKASDTPLLVLTGSADEEAGILAVQQGAQDYILKETLRHRTLPRAIRYAIERHRLERLLREANAGLEETVRRRTSELARSEHLKSAILEASLDAIVTIDHRGNVVEFNRAAEATFGFGRDEVVGRPMAEVIIPPRLREAHHRGLARFLATGEAPIFGRRLELEALRADGSEFPAELTVVPIRSDGEPMFTGFIRDITQRRQDEAALQRFRIALDNSADIIFIADRETMRLVDANQTACRLLGYTREELLRMGPQDILAVERGELEGFYDALPANESRTSSAFTYYRCRGGALLPVEPSRRIVSVGGRELVVAVSRDIRQRLAAEQALKESEAGLRRAQEMARLAHVITGEDGVFERWSETLPGLARLEAAQMPGSTREWIALVHPEDHGRFRDAALAAERSGSHAVVDYRLQRADGETAHIRQTMEPLGSARWFNTLQDVTSQKHAELRIARLNRIHSVLSGINTLIVREPPREELFREACRIAVESGGLKLAFIALVDEDGTKVTPAAWSGDDAEFVALPRPILPREAPAHGGVSMAYHTLQPVIINDVRVEPGTMMHQGAALQRGYRSAAFFPLVLEKKAVGILSLYAGEVNYFDDEELKLLQELAGDIAFALEHLQKSERADYLAYYDQLTGLANRTLFEERLRQHLEAAQRNDHGVALSLFDIERFRTVNDSLGRMAGDELLRQLAERLKLHATDVNNVARLSADQFAVVSPNVVADELARRTETRIHQLFDAPFAVAGRELRIGARFGIAFYPGDAGDPETLFRNAEAALRRAKDKGERYVFYTQEMTERVAERLDLENRLRRALEKEEFVLHYQPKVDLEARRVVGVEALIRWQSPERGLVPPGHFIPLLEETGMILEVGAWAIRRAVMDHRHWLRQGLPAPRVAVNVSQIQLRQADFVETVRAALGEGAQPTGLDLEITESLLMENVEANIRGLAGIRSLGVNIAIDDFGTGYSSLSYLARLPVQALKIDRSFIIAMLDDPAAMTLVQTIISLAHALRLKVVAEGVEKEEQAKMLRLLRCDEMQGFLVSKPRPVEELTQLLQPKA